MRASTTVIAAATSSGLISGTLTAVAVHLRLGISLGPHEQFELIALIVVQVIVALGTALVLAIVLAAARSQSTLASAAIVLAVVLLVALGALEVFGLTTSSGAAFSAGNAFSEDLPLLGVIAVPSLLTILIQWCFVRGHLSEPRMASGRNGHPKRSN